MSISFFNSFVSEKAIASVSDVLRSGFLSEGHVVERFENALEKELGLCNVVTTNSGTSALHIALMVAGIREGDEVIVPPQTFVATALSVLYVGAKPIFADIDESTGNISTSSISKKITSKTRGVICVHWAGYPCDLSEIRRISVGNNDRNQSFWLISDAAHALGAIYKGNPVGGNDDPSDINCFSFQAIKHLSVGDGGAITFHNSLSDLRADARRCRWFGIDRQNDNPNMLGERQYELRHRAGLKAHMNNVAAAIGLGNLDGFQDRLMKRVQNAATYDAHFRTVSGVTLMNYKSDRISSYWIYPIRVERRDDFVRAMTSRGVPVSVVHQRIDRHPIFGGLQDLPGQALFDATQINLPVHDGLTYEDVTQVIDAVKGGW